MPGSMPPKPSTSIVVRGPRGRVCQLFSRGPRAPGAVAVDPRAASMALSSLWRTWPREVALLRTQSAFGRGPGHGQGRRMMECTGRRNRPPWIPPPAGPSPPGVASIPPGCLGGYLHHMRFGTHWRAHAWTCPGQGGMQCGRESDKVMFRYRLEVDWGHGEASHCVDVAWFRARVCVLARNSSLHALPLSSCTCPPILETNRVIKVSIV